MYLSALSNIFSSKGRINRRQYLLILILFAILAGSLVSVTQSQGAIYFASLFIIPSQIKRLHDLNLSGWFVLLALVPLANLLLGLGLVIFSGSRGENNYGFPPHLAKPEEK